MDVPLITMPRVEALQKVAAYQRAMKRSKNPELAAAEAGYAALAEGRSLLDLNLAVGAGGWTPEGHPRFAVARADRLTVRYEIERPWLRFDSSITGRGGPSLRRSASERSNAVDRDEPSGQMPDTYDRLLGGMHGLPDVVQTKPSTVRYVEPLVGRTQTYIVQTIRQRDLGDHVFLEIVNQQGSTRVVIPPNVADLIARQRDAVSTQSRRKAARAVAQERKERGEAPAFMKNPGQGRRSKGKR